LSPSFGIFVISSRDESEGSADDLPEPAILELETAMEELRGILAELDAEVIVE
jgi:hypothetical protein